MLLNLPILSPEVVEEDKTLRRIIRTKKLQRVRRRLLAADPHCTYCRRRLSRRTATLDHRVPRSQGGTDARDNLVLSCRQCNGCKSGRTPLEWIADILGAIPVT